MTNQYDMLFLLLVGLMIFGIVLVIVASSKSGKARSTMVRRWCSTTVRTRWKSRRTHYAGCRRLLCRCRRGWECLWRCP